MMIVQVHAYCMLLSTARLLLADDSRCIEFQGNGSELDRRFDRRIRRLGVFYFLRSMTLLHIFRRPFLASLSGKLAMAWAARSTWSWANARVCSMPSLSITRVRAWRLHVSVQLW